MACDVAAHAWVRVPLETLAELRRQPGPGFDAPLPVGALKQADEQTVAAVAAVAQAAHRYGLDFASFHAWAVLAAPHFMGRSAVAAGLQRYQNEGAWGASPHLPPHRSLHSPSGAVSQVFKIHGPNYGVCGGPGCAAEILAAAAAMIDARRVPGVWAVLTALDPDLPPDRAGAPAPGTVCAALALALTPPRSSTGSGIRLRIAGAAAPGAHATRLAEETAPSLDLFVLQGRWTLWRRRRMSAAPASYCRWRRAAASKSSGFRAATVRERRTAPGPDRSLTVAARIEAEAKR